MMTLNKRSNILFRKDTWKMIEDIAANGGGTPSQLVRYAVYNFLDQCMSGKEYISFIYDDFTRITKSRDNLYVPQKKEED